MTRMMSDRIVTARDPAEGNRKPGLDTRNHHIPLCRKQLAILAALDDHALGARGSDSAAQGKTQAFPASAREISWIGLDNEGCEGALRRPADSPMFRHPGPRVAVSRDT